MLSQNASCAKLASRGGRKYLLYNMLLVFLIFARQFAYSQPYTVGVAVSDTIDIGGYGGCPQDQTLSIQLDSTISPYVSGLKFQLIITAIDGTILTESQNRINVGDTLSLPAANESEMLLINLKANSGFSFITSVTGKPLVVGERYFCEILWSITTALCSNRLTYFGEGEICEVEDIAAAVTNTKPWPTNIQLMQNYPNPFNPSTMITYSLTEPTSISLGIFNVRGQKVRTLVDNTMQTTGEHAIQWDGMDDQGVNVATGVYLYRIDSDRFYKVKKMLLIR